MKYSLLALSPSDAYILLCSVESRADDMRMELSEVPDDQSVIDEINVLESLRDKLFFMAFPSLRSEVQ